MAEIVQGDHRRRREADRLAAQAMRLHRADPAGARLDAAERLWQAALALVPSHSASLHGLGCAAQARGRPDIAIGLIGQAVAAEPEQAEYAISLGLALLQQGHGEAARAALQVACLLAPRDPRASRALAQAQRRLGQMTEAEGSLRHAIALDPQDAAGWLSLGGVLQAEGRLAEAAEAFREATLRSPRDPLGWHALAAALGQAGDVDGAERAFRQVSVLLPDDAAAQANLATALWAQDRLEQARPLFRAALDQAPDEPATLSGLGLVLLGLGETDEAEAMLSRASVLAPEASAVAINHGTALAALERRAEAEAVFRAVLAREPGNVSARFNHATTLLARGALAQGWAGFEARRQLGPAIARPDRLPEWDGSAGSGQVLIRAEQGLGDTIQFLRWVPLAARRVPLRLELPAAMLRLARLSGFDRAAPDGPADIELRAASEPALGCVAEAGLMSLPHFLRHPVPPVLRLAADPVLAAGWRERLGGSPHSTLVGLCWAGSASYRFDRQRSMPLAALAPLGSVPGLRLVSLQAGDAALQPDPPGLAMARPALDGDWAQTAALVVALDLLISVDTAVAHLAGALGTPVWLLDRFGGDWRWGAGFAHGARWYPSLRRFGQEHWSPRAQAWDALVLRVRDALQSEFA
ncbi:tetratricopeptide repeat protein [Lichenicoccus sp.]|uniref:tetratricopeptide repeat protein n=1 Tax=Lichenicoccus sp. TaxID=2781899 RepID=UPI003D12A3BE